MFTNPIGQMFGKPDEPEKKKKRAKRVKKLSPEASEEQNEQSSQGAGDGGVTFEEVQGEVEQAQCSGLMDIVNEINSAPVVEEPIEEITTEPTETHYEEVAVDESMIKAVIEGMSNQNEQQTTPAAYVQDCWETMLSTPPNEESTWESEVAAAPQSVDSVWESMLSSAPNCQVISEPTLKTIEETAPLEAADNNSSAVIKDQFKLSDVTYELAREFYDDQKEEIEGVCLLKNDLLKYLLVNAISQRSELNGVSEEDIERALNTVDSDNDNRINFDEFVQLLALFFSSKNNLKQRISGVLDNHASSHEKTGSLTASEASIFTNFLHNFFGKHDEEEVKHRENFLSKLIKKVIKKKEKKENKSPGNEEIHEIDYATFTEEATRELEELCFVKFL